MSLVSLILIGALIGWMAAIVTRREDAAGIRRNIALGLIGSLVAGLIANNGVMLGSLRWIALAAGIAGAIFAPALYELIERSRST